jgi:hypothetical protein
MTSMLLLSAYIHQQIVQQGRQHGTRLTLGPMPKRRYTEYTGLRTSQGTSGHQLATNPPQAKYPNEHDW